MADGDLTQQPLPLPQMSPGTPALGGALPPTSPVQPQQSLDPTQVGAQAMQRGTQLTEEQLHLGNARSQQAIDEAMKPYQTPDPKYGYSSKFDKITGPGSFIKDLGKALLLASTMTGPGQAVEQAIYGPGQRARAAEIGERQRKISALEAGAKAAEEPVSAVAQMGPRYGQAIGAVERGRAAELNAQNRAVHDRAMEKLGGELNRIKADYNAGRLTAEAAQTAAYKAVGEGRNAAIMSVAGTYADQRDRDAQVGAFEQEYKVNTDNMIRTFLGGLLGIAPQQPSTREGAPPGPKAAGSAVIGEPKRPSNVPKNYIYRKSGPHGEGWYKPGT